MRRALASLLALLVPAGLVAAGSPAVAAPATWSSVTMVSEPGDVVDPRNASVRASGTVSTLTVDVMGGVHGRTSS